MSGPEQIEQARPRRFRPYPEYKDSGVEWLGEIPAHWDMKRLKYVAPVSDERVYGGVDDEPYVALDQIESWMGRLHADSEPHQPESTTTRFRAGDVLFGKLRPYLAKVVCADFAGHCSAEILVLRPNESLEPKLLSYQLLSDGFIRSIDSLTYGTKMPRANPSDVENMPAAIPPFQEQRAIAAFLDRETAKIDALVARKERLIELLQEKRTALITRAVTKGLDPTVPMKDSGVEWLGEIPAHWEVKPLKHVAEFVNGVAFKPSEWGEEGTPIIRIENLNGGDNFNHTSRQVPPRFHAQKGDLLFGWSGNRGTSFGPFLWWREGLHYVNQHIFKVVNYEVREDWLYWMLRGVTFYVEKQAHGIIGMVHITRGELGKIPVPIIPLDEQERIASFIEGETARIDALVAKVREAIDRLKEFRTALISAAVTGKIDVREEVTD